MTTADALQINSAACQVWFYLNIGKSCGAEHGILIGRCTLPQIQQAVEIVEAINAEPSPTGSKTYHCIVAERDLPHIKEFCDSLPR